MSDRVSQASSFGGMAARIREYDWGRTSLGPMSEWPPQLRAAVDLMLPSQAQIVLFCGADLVAIYNDAYVPTIGTKHPDALGKPAREYWAELWDDLEPLLRAVMEKGETVVAKDRPFYIERGAGAETVFFDISYSPIRDTSGAVIAVFCVVSETTDRVEYEARLRRLASIVFSSEDAILGIDLDMIVTDWNSGAEKLYGFRRDEILGKSVTVLIPPDRLDEETRIIEHIKAGGRVEPHETVRRRKGGELVEVSLSVSPIFDATGRIVGASKIARDITDRKNAERIQKVLTGEINHRVKNLLATVLAIARQTFNGVDDLEVSKATFEARLLNLAKAHDLLTSGNWEKASLEQIVHNAVLPFQSDRFRIGGPEVNLTPKGALAVALILHELATNAAKHGALAVTEGHVDVSWAITGANNNRFTLIWQEADGPAVSKPNRTGFGSRLIRAMVGQLGGDVELVYSTDGFRCDIDAPLATDWDEADHELVSPR